MARHPEERSGESGPEPAHGAPQDPVRQDDMQSQPTNDSSTDPFELDREQRPDDETYFAGLEPEEASEASEAIDTETMLLELEQTRDRLLRTQSELENYRKRAQRTLEEERRFASLPLMRDLLTVVDNLRRALDAAQQHENASGLQAGVAMVADELTAILKRHHCEEISTEGARFDPHLHEAIGQMTRDDLEPGMIAYVAQTGYQLHGRVVRPSQVLVAAARAEDQER